MPPQYPQTPRYPEYPGHPQHPPPQPSGSQYPRNPQYTQRPPAYQGHLRLQDNPSLPISDMDLPPPTYNSAVQSPPENTLPAQQHAEMQHPPPCTTPPTTRVSFGPNQYVLYLHAIDVGPWSCPIIGGFHCPHNGTGYIRFNIEKELVEKIKPLMDAPVHGFDMSEGILYKVRKPGINGMILGEGIFNFTRRRMRELKEVDGRMVAESSMEWKTNIILI